MTIHLIRHASAGRRSFSGDDLGRPLDDYGREQAELIGTTLAGTGVDIVLSSRATRCMQTVGPLAAACGLEVEPHGALLEGGSTSRALELIRSLEGQTAVLCSHGDIIPETIRALEVGGTVIDADRSFAKGTAWTLTFANGRIDTAACTRFEP